jgi:hypothetical protein
MANKIDFATFTPNIQDAVVAKLPVPLCPGRRCVSGSRAKQWRRYFTGVSAAQGDLTEVESWEDLPRVSVFHLNNVAFGMKHTG